MKILSVVGARPQFIKTAAVSRVLRGRHQEILVHTGQHYDHQMSRTFFDGLDIPDPDHDLGVGSGSHAEQTAAMLIGLELVISDERPDMVLVYGDTNSTLAAALTAAKLQVPLAHVEAGLRSFNKSMPEEINRVITDRLADLLFCPTPASVQNLERMGINDGVHLVGDVMFDVALDAGARAEAQSAILERLGLDRRGYLLATVHRAGNTDDHARLRAIAGAFIALEEPLVLPVHPRTRKCLRAAGLHDDLAAASHVILTEPLGYLDFTMLQRNARKILTDSGGVQKEACFYKVPCITLRDETEWVETIESGWNVLVGADTGKILREVKRPFREPTAPCQGIELWDGKAAQRIDGRLDSWAEERGLRTEQRSS